MDPLFVSASILGILSAAASVSSVLITFVKNVKGTPKLAQTVINEVNGLSAVLGPSQNYLIGAAIPSKSGASLILVEQVLVSLAECVTTFSELEEILAISANDGSLSALNSMKWALKESKIADILEKLYDNKATLTLMLTIFQCTSMEEAENATNRLCTLVERVLAENQNISLRLRDMDQKDRQPTTSTRTIRENITDDASVVSDGASTPRQEPMLQGVQRDHHGFAFEEDLWASRVYRRPLFSDSGETLATSAARTTASSILSALSLTDVSNISILAVPIYAHEISNSRRYTFGDFDLELSTINEHVATKPPEECLKANKWDRFASAVWRGRKDKRADTVAQDYVLGVDFRESIKLANVAISLTDEEGQAYIYGYIPTFVAKVIIHLKDNATDVENLFMVSGSATRLRELEVLFNSPPRYGKGLDWTGYTVHDAATILLRYLLRLPEPIIPSAQYEEFQMPLQSLNTRGAYEETPELGKLVATYQKLISGLPPSSRHLLLYLLDFLAVVGSKQEINKMTSPRLAAVFQPVILSPVKVGEDFIEVSVYKELSQDVIVYLIENLDNFLVGMNEPDDHDSLL